MKKVLLIGFLWPYLSGSKRVMGLAQYLGEFGWEPLVLTPRLPRRPSDAINVIETDYTGLLGKSVKLLGLAGDADLGDQLKDRVSRVDRRLRSVLRWAFNTSKQVVAYPDEHRGWRPHALAAADEAVVKMGVNALISVYPITGHLVARDIRQKHNIPWIADSPDLWSDNSAYPYGRLRRWLDQRLEVDTFRYADALTTTSQALGQRLSALHGGRRVEPIMIGFDPEILESAPVPLVSDQLTITYTGMFYQGKRDPGAFFEALQELIAERRVDPKRIAVRIYGPKHTWVDEKIDAFGLSGVVQYHGSVPLKECVARQRESHLLLQINWSDPRERGVFSGKFLDYLAAKRPILAVGGCGCDDEVIRILGETNAGVYAVTREEIKHAVEGYFREYSRTGTICFRGRPGSVDSLSNRAMAAAFAAYLNEIVSGSSDRT